MAFTDLPNELLSEIGHYIEGEDLHSLCLSSRGLMELLQHKVYRNLYLSEDRKSGSEALAISSGPRKQFIRHICYAPSDPRPIEDEEHDDSIKLSDETSTMLKTLSSFPNLESFRMDLQEWDLGSYPQGALYYSIEGPNTETREPWRTLLNDSFSALWSSSGAFSTLEIYHLPPIWDEYGQEPAYSAFKTNEWTDLLGNIKTFDMQLAEIPGDGGSNMTCAHQGFLARLGE
ncbi:hypothetical protein IMZ48_46660 [Candidatus Bathyarchaeota archaeon]|nr:hypothetical protein [Candidatus Bathyarchaeota archaeon]